MLRLVQALPSGVGVAVGAAGEAGAGWLAQPWRKAVPKRRERDRTNPRAKAKARLDRLIRGLILKPSRWNGNLPAQGFYPFN